MAATAAAMLSCSQQQRPHYDVHRQCVDKDQFVVDDRYCQQQGGGALNPYPYRWYYYGGGSYYSGHTTYVPAPYGSRASGGSFSAPSSSPAPSSGTERGIFGGTAEGHGFSGGGAGE